MNASQSSSIASTATADTVFMDRALELAARGVALASPNPLVGAVLVRDGKIIGEGFHTYEGIRHAEIVALEEAGQRSAEGFESLVGRAFGHDVEAKNSAGVLTTEAANAHTSGISEAARGATVYINLEPCCHTGRTGPCTKALIAAGVAARREKKSASGNHAGRSDQFRFDLLSAHLPRRENHRLLVHALSL